MLFRSHSAEPVQVVVYVALSSAKHNIHLISGVQTVGLTLAARLTEDPNTTVLLLEAGNANIGDMALRE